MLKAPAKAFTARKILPLAATARLIAKYKKQGKTVGLCHGGFDLLHPGHIKHFESAKKLCDILVVSITSDRFVSERKGTGRPIFSDTLRAYMVAHLDVVDYVVTSDFKLGVDVIYRLQPSYYIKGPDMINRQTPGITAERQAIVAIGGKILYTRDPKLSSTEIIDYIQTQMKDTHLLLVLDRDGTLITNDEFLGGERSWKKDLRINEPVISLLSYLQTKYKTTKVVITNQSGVARGYFPQRRVREIHRHLNGLLAARGITIQSWQFCPDVDTKYVASHPEVRFVKTYVKESTKRKPSPAMVKDALAELKKDISQFTLVLVLGDREDDNNLASNLHAYFIDVKGKTYEELVKEITRYLKQ